MALFSAPEVAGSWVVPRLQHELNFLLFASEGRVEEAITEFEGMVEQGWRWLRGPSSYLISASIISTSIYRFEDNPMLDSVRDHSRFIELLEFVKEDLAAQKEEVDAGLTIADIEH